MPNAPFYYNYMNAVESAAQPANMHILSTETGRFYQRYLLKKALSVFKWTLPAWWDENYFLYVLYCFGFVGIFDTERFGVIPNQCGLKGLNVFYRPTSIIIANPLLTEKEKRIDADCVVMQLQPDYMGILDLCAHYAEKMALASSATSQNLWSTKIATVFFAENDAQAQSIKKAFDKMSAGDPMVVVNKKLRDENGNLAYEVFNRDVKQSYVINAPELIQYFQYVVDMDPVHNGYPLCEMTQINTLSGFILVGNADEFTANCMAVERQAVIQYLEGGFYYE